MSEPLRIVSLLASATELVCALGLGERLVGRSHECDYPAWVRALPEVSRPTFDISGSSLEIDELVRARLREGQPLYRIDEALLVELRPDLLITQTHCEVCAVSPADLVHRGPARLTREPVLALGGSTLAAILASFIEVALALGRPDAGADLVAALRQKLGRVATRVHGRPRPRVACIEWIEPVFTMGNWGPELVELAGGQSVLGTAIAHSTTTPFRSLLEADPQVLVVAPCGFDLDRARSEMHRLAANPGFSELRAVRDRRVYVADGNSYFNRSGPRLFDTPEILAEMLHPAVLAPRHRDAVWQPWPA